MRSYKRTHYDQPTGNSRMVDVQSLDFDTHVRSKLNVPLRSKV